VSTRYEVQPFSADLTDAAAALLADRHRRARQALPALNPAFEDRARAAERIAELSASEAASGAMTFRDGQPVAYALGHRKSNPPWGANVWVEDAGCAASDGEGLRLAYAAAAARWRAEGAIQHYVLVPASDAALIEAWFSLDFGHQHVHALREAVDATFEPAVPEGLTIRRAERRDLPALAETDLVLPRHTVESPVFSIAPVPSFDAILAELEEDFDDPRFTTLVIEHEGRVIASATACSLEESGSNTPLLRPVNCGFLGYAAVLPEARGLGAGRALGEAVLAWSRDEGYEWVATDWRSTNIEANRSWRAIGFRPSYLRLHRSLG
jgi:GNAT superfamily N-acetyltransferase